MGQVTFHYQKPTHDSLMKKSKSDLAYELKSAYEFQARQGEMLKRMWGFIEQLESEAKDLPLGHENEERGKSSYNWIMWFVRRFNKAAIAQFSAKVEET